MASAVVNVRGMISPIWAVGNGRGVSVGLGLGVRAKAWEEVRDCDRYSEHGPICLQRVTLGFWWGLR